MTDDEFRHRLNFNKLMINQLKIRLYASMLLRVSQEKKRKKRTSRPRRWFTRSWILERPIHGHYHQLLRQLSQTDKETFKYYLRMDAELFDHILGRIEHRISRQDTNWRKALEPGLRLAVTLRFLATGEAFKSMALNFRMGPNSISKVVPDTCEAIIQEFMDEVIICPTTPEGWKEVAKGFSNTWNFHHVLGALDGKHVALKPPGNSGSHYYNYKGYHSIVLLALVDCKGKFLYVDVGANGSCSDAGIFQVTDFRKALEDNAAGLPDKEPLPMDDKPMPYFIVADDAFPMRDWLQKPYPIRGLSKKQRAYNYRLSRARMVVENAFGMWANRFRCFLTTINVLPTTVEKMIIASCILHNILIDKRPGHYQLPVYDSNVPRGDWTRDPLDGLEPRQRQSGPAAAKTIREYLTDYYARPDNLLRWQRL